MNSMSIFCGLCLMSIRINADTSCLRCEKYEVMNFWNLLLAVLDTLAYPYPGKSTKNQFSLILKWLISWVLPGLPEVLARLLRSVSILIKEDFPTFERPINAYSGSGSLG